MESRRNGPQLSLRHDDDVQFAVKAMGPVRSDEHSTSTLEIQSHHLTGHNQSSDRHVSLSRSYHIIYRVYS